MRDLVALLCMRVSESGLVGLRRRKSGAERVGELVDRREFSFLQSNDPVQTAVVLAVSPNWNRRLAEAVPSLICHGCGHAFENSQGFNQDVHQPGA